MTLAKTGSEVLTKEEWNELIALKEAITYAPQTVSAQKMEKFAEFGGGGGGTSNMAERTIVFKLRRH